MSLAHVSSSSDPLHVTACPFVLPETPVPATGVGRPDAANTGATQEYPGLSGTAEGGGPSAPTSGVGARGDWGAAVGIADTGMRALAEDRGDDSSGPHGDEGVQR